MKCSSSPTTPSETETKNSKLDNIPSTSSQEVKPIVEELTPTQIDAMLLFISFLMVDWILAHWIQHERSSVISYTTTLRMESWILAFLFIQVTVIICRYHPWWRWLVNWSVLSMMLTTRIWILVMNIESDLEIFVSISGITSDYWVSWYQERFHLLVWLAWAQMKWWVTK